MNGMDIINSDELVSGVCSGRTRAHSLRVKEMRVKMVVKQGTFTQSS